MKELVRVHVRHFKARGVVGGVAFIGLVLSCFVAANSSVAPSLELATTEPVLSRQQDVDELRVVRYFFSAEAWGGLPFSETQEQQVMVRAMVEQSLVRMELEVTHLLSAPEARVRSFTAVFEVDGRAESPRLRAGYELELLVPHNRVPLTLELINAETGRTNLVEVAPEGSL